MLLKFNSKSSTEYTLLKSKTDEMSLFSRKNSIINELIYLGTLPNFSKVSSQKLRSIVNSSCASSGQTTRTFADKKQHDAGEFLSSKKDANQNLGIT